MSESAPIPATADELAEARTWLADCLWSDVDGEMIADPTVITDAMVYCAVAKHFEGGWPAFRDLHSAPTGTGSDEMALTMYRVLAYGHDGELLPECDGLDGAGVLFLGRDDAEQFATDLFAGPEVDQVLVSPLAWDSADEEAVILASACNGTDLHTPMAAIADERGIDYDPDNFDPVAMLLNFRQAATARATA